MPLQMPQKRVLIIDDEPAMLKVLAFGLSRHYAVTAAPSGEAGLREFEREPFDLVVSDRTMPEMDGDEVAVAVKLLAPETPIILMSGVGGLPVDPARFAAYFHKPFPVQSLLTKIDDLLVETVPGPEGT